MSSYRINLELCNALRNADADYPEELFHAVKRLPNWELMSLNHTDDILSQWISDAFGTSDNREGWTCLNNLICRIQVIQPIEEQPERMQNAVVAFYFRWEGMAKLLQARAHRDDNHDPAQIESKEYMSELRQILKKHGKSEVTRPALEAHLNLRPERIGQLLDLAEAGGLITRRTKDGMRMISVAGIWSEEAKK